MKKEGRVCIPLEKSHNRKAFRCEEEALTRYLKEQVSQDKKKKLAACYVLINDEQEVIGYYTLSSASISREEVPEKYQDKVPKNYGVPVVLIGRLARDERYGKQKLGEFLLIDAFNKIVAISDRIGIMAITVDPISEIAVRFYEKYGFIKLDSGKMFIPLSLLNNFQQK